MKQKIYLLIIFVAIAFYCKAQLNTSDLIKYPWIPLKLKWDSKNYYQSSFETIYFYSDSEFIKIASTQSLAKKDSINFRAEPGFILYKGNFLISKNKTEISLKYRRVYRTFEVSGEKLPSDYILEKIMLLPRGKNKLLNIKGKQYTKTYKFKKESLNALNDIVYKFLPSLPL